MDNGYIDIVCNVFTPQTVREERTGIDDEFKRQVRMPEGHAERCKYRRLSCEDGSVRHRPILAGRR